MDREARPNPIEILMIEDSPSDALLAREALAQARLRNSLHVVEDGVEALAFLRREGPYANAPRPHLILLDLNLPRKDGREVLAEIKDDADLRLIPVVVLTTSKDEKDVLQAYGLHANCYIVKPVDFDQFIQVVQSIEHFWFTVVALPYA
jgi:chemotaxis family two-component system response regulator Rcp1